MTKELQAHLQLGDNHGAKYALLPGDPKRIDRVKDLLTDPIELAYNREYRTVLGHYQGIPILVTSTGIGGPSAGIAVEELANLGVSHLIRIGSSGALQKDIQLGELIIATGAVRDEGTTHAFVKASYPALADSELTAVMQKTAEELEFTHHLGIVRSHDSFYTDHEEETDAYWSNKGILGADMETAALFVLGALRGLKTASVLNVVVPAEGNLETGINDLVKGEDLAARGEKNQILLALDTIVAMEKENKQ